MRNDSGLSHKKLGEITLWVSPNGAKCVFLPRAGVRIQRGLSATYCARISTVFETTDENECAGGKWREKFPNFCTRSFAGPQSQFWGFRWGTCTESTAHTPQFPKDVHFVGNFWRGPPFGGNDPQKTAELKCTSHHATVRPWARCAGSRYSSSSSSLAVSSPLWRLRPLFTVIDQRRGCSVTLATRDRAI